VVLAANSAWNIANFRGGLVRALKEHGYEPVVVAPADPTLRLGELAVRHVEIPIERSGLNPLADLSLLMNYRRILKRLRPVAYLGFTIKPNIYGGHAAATLGIPAIANISGLGTTFIKSGPLRSLVTGLYRFALRRTPVVFFQNPDDRAEFVDGGLVRSEQTRLLPGSGIDLGRFLQVPLPDGPVTFLFIGRMLGDKGVCELIEASRLLRKDRADVRVQLLGAIDDGNRTAIKPTEIDRTVSDGLVEYLGETNDVRPFIDKASAVVLPSYREGLPRSLLEAGAMGRPLIATDVPGCREVVEDGVNGFLCEARSPSSLIDAMNRFIQLSNEQRAQMGDAARQKVESQFSESVVIQAYLDALGHVAPQRS
jgi:glycosyltransferase involved in cell wall biosynthesis